MSERSGPGGRTGADDRRPSATGPAGSGSAAPKAPVRLMETLAIVVMVLLSIVVVATIVGRSGLDLVDLSAVDDAIAIRSEVTADDAVDGLLGSLTTATDRAVAQSGVTPVHPTAPVEVDFRITAPTSMQRLLWVIAQISGPLLALAITWMVYGLIRSVRSGDPFTAANERRLWTIAGLVGVGATVVAVFGGIVRMIILQRSAAADLVPVTVDIGFLPLIAAGMIAVLASVWRSGVALRADVDGLV
ncbi:MAG: DUF2975 domain-containing protein [Ilumatobacteraceae bacterium]